ncbi:hypothetical protein KSZ_04410 [Dictyobacter formicarum]|uniref:Uncharacterized protein n=1 Tax=Dictyobacter formicarum TaxID=2778368 RepID=A0ABQ3V956_9CHLR|nr:hypothetical protein KSZ_04410 [Dictyobacter formicarum]
MPGFARQAGQPLPKRRIQALNKGGIEHVASSRQPQQLFRLLQEPMSHPASNFDHAFFLRPLDDGANMQVWPDL